MWLLCGLERGTLVPLWESEVCSGLLKVWNLDSMAYFHGCWTWTSEVLLHQKRLHPLPHALLYIPDWVLLSNTFSPHHVDSVMATTLPIMLAAKVIATVLSGPARTILPLAYAMAVTAASFLQIWFLTRPSRHCGPSGLFWDSCYPLILL